MSVEQRITEAFRALAGATRLPSVAEIARAADVSWPTAKRTLERLGLACGEGLLPAETRERILAAAEAEFGVHGYQRTALEAIARRAGVSKGAIYRHFKSKEHLLAAIMELHFDREIEEMEEDVRHALARSKDLADSIPALLERQLMRHESHPAFARLFLQFVTAFSDGEDIDVLRSFERRLTERGRGLIARLQQNGLIDESIDGGALQTLWAAVVDGMTLRRAIGSWQGTDPAAEARRLGLILAVGLKPRTP